MGEHEITEPGKLLDSRGRLREPGWARSLLLEYDRRDIRANAGRIKEWDYYCLVSGDIVLAFTIADNGYMGLLSVSVIDLSMKFQLTESIMTAFPWGGMGLPRSSRSGVSEASAKGLSLRFESENGHRRLQVRYPGFGSTSKGRAEKAFGRADEAEGRDAVGFHADIALAEREPKESIVMATPFAGSARAFYYNQKINCQEAAGIARVGKKELEFKSGKSFAVLDWGRGVWPYSNSWLWGSASGLARAEGSKTPLPFGFNIGYGFGDTSAASENAVFFDGRLHKIGPLRIDFDERDLLRPWRAVSEDGRLDLELSPLLDRAAVTDLLILASIQHQVFGRWSGHAVLDDGRKIIIEGLAGFCEEVRNRW